MRQKPYGRLPYNTGSLALFFPIDGYNSKPYGRTPYRQGTALDTPAGGYRCKPYGVSPYRTVAGAVISVGGYAHKLYGAAPYNCVAPPPLMQIALSDAQVTREFLQIHETFSLDVGPFDPAGGGGSGASGGRGLLDRTSAPGQKGYFAHPVSAWLMFDPDGANTMLPLRRFQYTKNLNKGHTWSVTVSNGVTLPAFTSANKWRLHIASPDGEWVSPRLVAPVRMNPLALSGVSRNLTGVDATSWALATQGVSQPTLPFTSAAQVLALIERMVPGLQIINPPNQRLEEYTISGSTMQRHLEDVLLQCSYSYRVGPDGEIICFPSDYSFQTNRPLWCNAVTPKIDENQLYTHLKLIKHSKIASEFNVPYNTITAQSFPMTTPLIPGSIQAFDHPAQGHMGYAAFFDKSDGLVRIFTFDAQYNGVIPSGPIGNGPAVRLEYGAMPDLVSGTALGHLYVKGTPAPIANGVATFDTTPYFELNYPQAVPTGTTLGVINWGKYQVVDGVHIDFSGVGSRLNVKTVETSILPTVQDGFNILVRLWADAQKGFYTVARQLSRFDPYVDVGDLVPTQQWYNPTSRVTETFVPPSRTETVTMSLQAGGSYSQSLTGTVLIQPVAGVRGVRVDVPLDSYFAAQVAPQ